MTDTRRAVLKRGGAAVAALGTLSGCLGGGSDDGTETPGDGPAGESDAAADTATGTDAPDGTATGTETTAESATATDTAGAGFGSRPGTPAASLAEWMPAPGAIDQTDASGYAFLAMAPAALGEFEGDLGADALSQFDGEYPIPGVGAIGDLTALYQFARSASVVVGDIDRGRVEDGLRDFGFEAEDTRHGFQTLAASDQRVAAVGDEALVTVGAVSSGDDSDKRPVLEAVLDAKAGDGERYVDAVGDCRRLLDALGSAHLYQGRTHEAGETFENGVGEGTGYHVGSEETRVRASAVFTDGDADRSAMADWAGDSEAFLGGDPAVRADGRTVSAAALVPSGEVTGFPGGFPGPAMERERTGPPAVSFEFDYEETGDGVGVLTVSHEGGDAVSGDALAVRGTGITDAADADQTEPGPWQGSASGDDGSVVAGDSVAVGARSDYEIEIVWEPPERDMSVTLGIDEGPDH